MIDSTNPSELRGKKLVDPEGGEIGEVRDVYLNHRTDQPEFALVDSGLLGRKATLVPLAGASLDGPRLWVSVEKAQVSGAPTLDPEDEISAEQEAELYHHYGIDPGGSRCELRGAARGTGICDRSARERTSPSKVRGSERHRPRGRSVDARRYATRGRRRRRERTRIAAPPPLCRDG